MKNRTFLYSALSVCIPLCIVCGALFGIIYFHFGVVQEQEIAEEAYDNDRSGAVFTARDGGNLFGMVQERPLPERQLMKKRIALTFDDGPHPVHTSAVLDVLQKYNVPATFFVVGERASVQTGVILRMVQEGHQIGNHTWSHTADIRTLFAEIDKTSTTIERITGVRPTVFRPPNGELNTSIQQQSPYPIIMWSIDTRDWQYRDKGRIAEHALAEVRPGDIMLFHDLYGTTVDSLEEIITTLLADGYEFTTIDDLFGFSLHPGIAIPGEVYYYKDLTAL